MVSRASCWKNCEQIWKVTHDAQQDDAHLGVEGEPPAEFSAIRDCLTKKQEEDGGADFIFNIPVDLAHEVTGYSYDETPEIVFDNFAKPTFFRRLLGN